MIDDRSLILFYTQIEKPDMPGSYESYSCTVMYDQNVTSTNPEKGGAISVTNYDGSMSLMVGEDGVTNRSAQDLNSEDKSEYETWKYDTEDFDKYFYSKGSDTQNLSSQMCTSYRRIAATRPIAMKEGDVFKVQMGYKIYDRTFATKPIAEADGDRFELLIGQANAIGLAATLGAVATVFALTSF